MAEHVNGREGLHNTIWNPGRNDKIDIAYCVALSPETASDSYALYSIDRAKCGCNLVGNRQNVV
jgi:hypothetical protein